MDKRTLKSRRIKVAGFAALVYVALLSSVANATKRSGPIERTGDTISSGSSSTNNGHQRTSGSTTSTTSTSTTGTTTTGTTTTGTTTTGTTTTGTTTTGTTTTGTTTTGTTTTGTTTTGTTTTGTTTTGTTTTGTTSTGFLPAANASQSTQTTTATTTNSAIIQYNGSPTAISGVDHTYDPLTNTAPPVVLAPSTFSSGAPSPAYSGAPTTPPTGIYYLMQTTGSATVAVPNADPTCYYVQYSGGNPTGYRYQVAVSNTGTLAGYTPVSPAVGIEQQSTTADPTSNTDVTTVYASGTHNTDNQVQGGMTNTLADQTQSILAFIKNAKSQATKFVDLTPGVYAQNGADPSWGNPDTDPPNEAIVYASGSYVDGVWQSGDLHLGGTFKGSGILVVEVDDPSQAKLIMDGSAEWVGEVIVYSHKAPTGNNSAPLTFVGGGNALHIIGGAMILTGSGSALTQTVVKSAGQSDLMYDSKAIDQANKSYPAGMSVRSWRKLAP